MRGEGRGVKEEDKGREKERGGGKRRGESWGRGGRK